MPKSFLGRVLIGSAVVIAITASTSVPSAAECSRWEEWPAFRDVVPNANSVVIGSVVKILERDRIDRPVSFRLAVTDILRGLQPATLDLSNVRTDDPAVDCIRSLLLVEVGDEIALTFGGTPDVVEGPVSAVAFLSRTPDVSTMPGMQRLSVDNVRKLVGLPPTDSIQVAVRPAAAPQGQLELLFVLSFVGTFVLRSGAGRSWRRRSRVLIGRRASDR